MANSYVANRLHNSIAHFTVLADGSLSHQKISGRVAIIPHPDAG